MNAPGEIPSARPVRVLNVKAGLPYIVRFLDQYLGTILHYQTRKPNYLPCPGIAACNPAIHRLRKVWKAWAPGELLDPDAKLWWPTVIEVTENLDEMLKGRRLRGETWILSRAVQEDDKSPLQGEFVERVEPSTLRPTFAVLPVLQRVYHTLEINLGIPNPVPPRVVLAPEPGQLPEGMAPAETATPTPATPARLRDHLEQLERAGFKLGRTSQAKPSNGQADTNGHS